MTSSFRGYIDIEDISCFEITKKSYKALDYFNQKAEDMLGKFDYHQLSSN